MNPLEELVRDEEERQHEFPVAAKSIYMAHAGVSVLPRSAVEPMRRYLDDSLVGDQETAWVVEQVAIARARSAKLLGARSDEVALLGPTSTGISLVASGIPWEPGDEVVFYQDDYPANVYAWTRLERIGVRPVALAPKVPGKITWELVEAALTENTRLVALASCNFLSGHRIDLDTIGRNLQARDILFCVDGIQTLGAFRTTVEHIDFLCADSHKWMLGPAAAGVFFVKKSRHALLDPMLLGAWNVVSPEFVAQPEIRYYAGGRRYEPGILNFADIVGMAGAMELLLRMGVENISRRLLELRRSLLEGLRPLGFQLYTEADDLGPDTSDASRSAIVTVRHTDRDMDSLFGRLSEAGVAASLRRNRANRAFIRFSPHFYNTQNEIDRVVELLK